MANGAAFTLDNMQDTDIVGSLAGDDTILLVFHDNANAAGFLRAGEGDAALKRHEEDENMLDLLHIENIAIIERADIAFQPGFNALTGETGAGKSIVIDAMSAVLGQRASRDLIRTGADKAFVSATFSGVPALFGEFGLEPDEELLLQREIHADGKNTCRVNGRPFTVTQLRALGSRLLNIHGQHDGQQLLDEEQHQLYLDSFGQTEELLNTYAEKHQAFTEIHRQIRALQMDEARRPAAWTRCASRSRSCSERSCAPARRRSCSARRSFLRNGEKFISAVSEADYCSKRRRRRLRCAGLCCARRRMPSARVRRLDDGFAKICERLEDSLQRGLRRRGDGGGSARELRFFAA